MNKQDSSPVETPLTRRGFLKSSGIVAAATVAANFPYVLTSHAAADDPAIKVAIIGCGGRGQEAGRNVKAAASNVQIVAVADVFARGLGRDGAGRGVERALQVFPEVPKENGFIGWDGYQKAIAVPGVNYVILATPPGLRPMHFKAAIEAGKHVFCEKPVAVDAPGIRQMLEMGKVADEKKLCVVAGTQRHHQASYVETVKRIQDGMIGDIISLRAYWNQNEIWYRDPDLTKTDWENQANNWYHHLWLCGDHIVEQHLHNIDVCNWVMNGHPIRAYGMGGRQALGSKQGNIWDHFAVEYEYANGARMFSQCRQIGNRDQPTTGRVSEAVAGTKGTADPQSWIQPIGGERWRAATSSVNPYVQEHTDLIAAIRSGKHVNETQNVTESTMTCIIGRESAYSGKVINWDDAMKWKTSLMPEKLGLGPAPTPTLPITGKHEMT